MQENAALQKRANAATVNVKLNLNLSSFVGTFVAANRPGPKAGVNGTFAPSFSASLSSPLPTAFPPPPKENQEAIDAPFPLSAMLRGMGYRCGYLSAPPLPRLLCTI